MHPIIGFDHLNVGQKVKLKGKPEGQAFSAWEISFKETDGLAKIEGVIQRLDHREGIVRLFNHDFSLPRGIKVKDLQRNFVDINVLKAGDLVKLKGQYSPSTGWVPEKINMKASMGFDIDELHGTIDTIDRERKTLEVAGFTVFVTEKTTIEGF
jgi:hypothetical protein